MPDKPSSPQKVRLDLLIVEQGLAESREKAQAMILAGQVLSGDRLFKKAGEKIPRGTRLRVRGEQDRYVSRGAYKLLGALEAFGIELTGKICLDVGASTGGFTQVCLERGAKKVYAVDVGRHQLHWKIRSDPRVVALEGVNFRHAPEGLLPEKTDFACIDTSFISLKLILPAVKGCLKESGAIVALVKPQHEVGRDKVGKGGIVRDAEARRLACEEVGRFAQSIGLAKKGLIESTLKGSTGNIEYLIHLGQ